MSNKAKSITKGWDWTKNEDDRWLIPSEDSAYLVEKWSYTGLTKFLDLGCGLGRHAIYMAQHGFDVTAVDISEYGVSHLNEWAKKEKLTIKTHVCNMLSLPFTDNSFDCIIAYNVIYHTDTAGFIAVLNEIRRVLRPDGEFYLTLISKGTWGNNLPICTRIDENTILHDFDEREKDVPHFYVDIHDIKNLFTDWTFVFNPMEYCTYNMDDLQYYSKHWKLIVKQK